MTGRGKAGATGQSAGQGAEQGPRQPAEPTRLLIAAMGGEGGGVLAGWITAAALDAGLWVQRTSVPGVAQRTGATTYYLEFLQRSGEAKPIMALHPAPGRVDVLVATELLEAVRQVRLGFVTPDRTRLIASSHRTYTVDEKSSMTDGRLDVAPMVATCEKFARDATILDIARVAAGAGAHLNSVVLGLLAGSGALPIPQASFRHALQSGKRVSDANMRGFDAGLALTGEAAAALDDAAPDLHDTTPVAAMKDAVQPGAVMPVPDLGTRRRETTATRTHAPAAALRPSEETAFLPDEAAGIAAEGVRRLTDWQDRAWAETYLDHLRRIAAHDAATPKMLAATARNLALRMSYEDTHRVAELKLRRARLDRVHAEARARNGDIVDVREYMKPGPEEVFGMLPRALGARLTEMAQRGGWADKSLPMKVATTRFSGFIRLRLLAHAKRWRQRSLRHHEETTWLALWLGHVETALDRAPSAATEIAETAGLVRGYGPTYKRGLRNWHLIEAEIIAPCLDGRLPSDKLSDAVLQARLAANTDPDGMALDRVVASFREIAAPGLDAAE